VDVSKERTRAVGGSRLCRKNERKGRNKSDDLSHWQRLSYRTRTKGRRQATQFKWRLAGKSSLKKSLFVRLIHGAVRKEGKKKKAGRGRIGCKEENHVRAIRSKSLQGPAKSHLFKKKSAEVSPHTCDPSKAAIATKTGVGKEWRKSSVTTLKGGITNKWTT